MAPGQSLLFAFANGFFASMVYERTDWNYKSADLAEALKAAEEKTAQVLDATDPDLRRFKDRGGKLILYHGWNDPAISALNTVHYYESVVGAMGSDDVESFLRLYMAPGVQHCAGGPGADSFGRGIATRASDPRHSLQLALEQWVEENMSPSAIIASRYATPSAPDDTAATVEMSRPLCPYPEAATYKGSGDTNAVESFACLGK